MPPEIVDRVKAKSEAAGIKWERWQYNDNTCKPQVRVVCSPFGDLFGALAGVRCFRPNPAWSYLLGSTRFSFRSVTTEV